MSTNVRRLGLSFKARTQTWGECADPRTAYLRTRMCERTQTHKHTNELPGSKYRRDRFLGKKTFVEILEREKTSKKLSRMEMLFPIKKIGEEHQNSAKFVPMLYTQNLGIRTF